MTKEDEGGVEAGGGDSLHERINNGSPNLTIGNRRRFPAYTTWLPTLSSERRNGKPSMSVRRRWMDMML